MLGINIDKLNGRQATDASLLPGVNELAPKFFSETIPDRLRHTSHGEIAKEDPGLGVRRPLDPDDFGRHHFMCAKERFHCLLKRGSWRCDLGWGRPIRELCQELVDTRLDSRVIRQTLGLL